MHKRAHTKNAMAVLPSQLQYAYTSSAPILGGEQVRFLGDDGEASSSEQTAGSRPWITTDPWEPHRAGALRHLCRQAPGFSQDGLQ